MSADENPQSRHTAQAEGAKAKTVKEGIEVDAKLLEILVCPLTKGPLRYDRAGQELISDEAALAYPIRDGIPIMLVDEARVLGDDERAAAKAAKPSAPS
jgi:uncharacterized protein YbaR (Trm112 family)